MDEMKEVTKISGDNCSKESKVVIYQDGVHFRGVVVFVRGGMVVVWEAQGEDRKSVV